MDMQGQMQLTILGVSRYDFEGIRGAKVYAEKVADPTNLNVIGKEVIEFGCDFGIFEGFRNTQGAWPQLFDCVVEFGRGARGKASARIMSAKHLKAAPPASKA
jgi:hypothetical protein